LRLALSKGTATAPAWISTFEAADKWGKPPWEIAPGVGAVIWWLRFEVYQREIARAQEKAARQNSRR
jgi:hypothetical protein